MGDFGLIEIHQFLKSSTNRMRGNQKKCKRQENTLDKVQIIEYDIFPGLFLSYGCIQYCGDNIKKWFDWISDMIRRFTLLFIVGVVIIGGRTTSMGGDFAEVRDDTEDRTDRVRQTSLGIGYAGLRSEVDALWGPDAWGYVAKDPTSGGLAYNWYNITMTGTEFWAGQNRDDDWTGEESINRTSYIRLPFGFLFYGNHFDSISVSANAIIKFTPQSVAYWNPIPSTGYSFRIDPWVYDMYHLGGVSHYYYRGFGDSLFVVSFHDVRYCEDPYRDNPAYGKTLQVLLFRDGRIVFQYNSLMTTVPGSPFASGIDDNQGPFGLSCGNSFSNGIAITFYPPEPGIILSDPMVVPTSGGVSTEFHYHITYRNRTGAIPSIREIFIDGTPHNMEAPAGNYAAGVTFDYSPVILTPGSHNFYFYFADGTYVARSPEVGVHGGPTVYSALVGSYDIGGGNNDFPSLVAAADALRGGGAVGPVIFYIYDGSYDGQIDLPGDISGICSANPIIFQNAPGHHPTVTSTTGHGFYLTGADYITIQGLEITECLYDGIYCYYSGSDSSTYNVFSGNYIHDIGLGGNYCGIYLNRAGDTQVMGNEIDGDYNGIENHQGNRNLIANNMLYNAEYHGIRAYEGADNGYYFNSLYTDAILGMYKYNGQNTVVTNNIFYQVGSGIRYAYYVAGSVSAYPLISDYNDIYAPDAFAGYYLGNRQTLADFQAATGMDAHSISEDPLFVSIDTIMVNLHIDSSLPSPVDGRGTPIPSIEVDFDGEIRDILTPDIGADEITSLLAVGDLTIRIVSPLFQDIVLEWSAVAGTVEYKIYKSINSMTGFILIDSTASTVWMDSGVLAGDGRGLYYVIVSNTNRDHDMVSSGIQRHQTSVPRR